MSGAYLRTRIVDISFAIYAPSWLVSVRLGRVYLVYNGLNGGRPAAASPVESVLTGGPDRPRPGSMVTGAVVVADSDRCGRDDFITDRPIPGVLNRGKIPPMGEILGIQGGNESV